MGSRSGFSTLLCCILCLSSVQPCGTRTQMISKVSALPYVPFACIRTMLHVRPLRLGQRVKEETHRLFSIGSCIYIVVSRDTDEHPQHADGQLRIIVSEVLNIDLENF